MQERIDDAIATVKQLQAQGLGGDKPRASTTDPDARVMKMPDGGFRPAYNVQFATAGEPEGGPRTVVGVRVTNVGSDMGSISPMLDDIERRTGQLPEILLADANHASFSDLNDAAQRGVTALVAVPDRVRASKKKTAHSPAIDEWLERMDTEEAKQTMRARASLCELTNGHAKTRFAMASLLVRGLDKVTCIALLTALTMNLVAHAALLV